MTELFILLKNIYNTIKLILLQKINEQIMMTKKIASKNYFMTKKSCIPETLNLLTSADRSRGCTNRRTKIEKL